MVRHLRQHRNYRLLIILVWGLFSLPGNDYPILNAQNTVDWDTPSSALCPILQRYASDYASLDWTYDIPMSEARLARWENFFRDWLNRLGDIDFSTLNQDGRIDYILFRNLLDYEMRSLVYQAKLEQEMLPFIPFAQTIVQLEENRRNMAAMDSRETASRLYELDKVIQESRDKIEAALQERGRDSALLDKTVAYRAEGMTRRLRDILKRWFDFYNGYDPLFTWWADLPYRKVDKALEGYASFLRHGVVGIDKQDNEGPIIGDPIGRQRLLDELAHEMIPYTPEQLISAGEKAFAWCEAEMIRASRDMGFGDDWHKALEEVKTRHVPPGEQPYLIRDQAWEAIAFVEKHNLITIPPLAKETWKIEMMSPERQKVNPFFTGGRVISVSYPTHTMSHEDKRMSMRGNNIHFARATVHHELIPGHHLQFFMTQRYKAYRRPFATPFWLEGWALHWEMLLWDLEFPQSPENRIGMLFWRMHRCARIIFSLSYHLGKMSAQECIDLLVNKVGHEPANATAEVRRSFAGDYPPLYQCAYMIGGLQMRGLYHELVSSGKMTSRAFHDAVLRENSIPIVMLRAKLAQIELDEDFKPDWMFLDESTKQ